MDESLYDSMFRLEQTHWWFVARRRIVLHLLERFGPRRDRPLRVADVGCGCGMMLAELTRRGYDAVGVDASPVALGYCRRRGCEVVQGLLPDGLDLADRSCDVVLAMDVLEHIEQDHASVRRLWRSVAPGGLFVCTVPAYRLLWTERDTQHHHLRRYGRNEFRRLVRRCEGGTVRVFSHMMSLLFPLAVTARLTSRLHRNRDGLEDLAVPSEPINTVFERLFESEKHVLSAGSSFPCGLSLVAVVCKDHGAGEDLT